MAENKPSKSVEQRQQEKFDEMESLRLEQASGDHKQIPANKNDQFQINEADKGMVHVRRVTRVNNPALMKYDEFQDVQQFGPIFFEQNKESLSAGYAEFEVIHDPKDNAKEPSQKAKSSKKAASKAEESVEEQPESPSETQTQTDNK